MLKIERQTNVKCIVELESERERARERERERERERARERERERGPTLCSYIKSGLTE